MRKKVDNRQELYDAAIARLREINLVKDYAGFVTEVIAPVELGELVHPKLLICLAVGGFLGLVVGVGSAGAAEIRDPFFLGPADVVQTLDLPILTQVPKLGTTKMGGVANGKRNSRLSPTISAFHRPRSPRPKPSAACDGHVLSFVRARQQGHPVHQRESCRRQVHAGCQPVREHCPGRAAHLLVDCDMRRPSVHTMFGLEPKCGLANVIAGEAELCDAIVDSEVPGLAILPCGPLPTNPAELLTSKKFAELLAVLRDRYDRVILDTPPLLAVADPAIVAAHVDGVTIAIRLTRDSRMQVIRAKELLESSRANVLGVAINSFDLTRRHRLATYAYGYGYGYGSGEGYTDERQGCPDQCLLSRGRGGRGFTGRQREAILERQPLSYERLLMQHRATTHRQRVVADDQPAGRPRAFDWKWKVRCLLKQSLVCGRTGLAACETATYPASKRNGKRRESAVVSLGGICARLCRPAHSVVGRSGRASGWRWRRLAESVRW